MRVGGHFWEISNRLLRSDLIVTHDMGEYIES
jgi:hypothetical protein